MRLVKKFNYVAKLKKGNITIHTTCYMPINFITQLSIMYNQNKYKNKIRDIIHINI